MSRTIADLTAGTLVYVDETVSGTTEHIPYIYLGIDEYGNARLLRQYASTQKRMNATNVASYDGCEADLWFENGETGFLSRFDSATINALNYTTIAYLDYNTSGDSTPQVMTIARRCFLLSYTELGWGATSYGSEGASFLPALKTFYNTNTDNTARIGKNESDTAVSYWVRSGISASSFRHVSAGGAAGSYNASYINGWLRPALSVASATSVSDEGADAIFLLPDGRTTTWGIQADMSLGETQSRPDRCKLFVPAGTMLSATYQVCNNYADDNPTWVNCLNGGVALFGTTKTAENWELGVKVNAQSATPGNYVGEPAMIVSF